MAKNRKSNLTNPISQDRQPMYDPEIVAKKVQSNIKTIKKKHLLKDLLNAIPKGTSFLNDLADQAAELWDIPREETSVLISITTNMVKKAADKKDSQSVPAFLAVNKAAGLLIEKVMPSDEEGNEKENVVMFHCQSGKQIPM